jgi:hypothetical protein
LDPQGVEVKLIVPAKCLRLRRDSLEKRMADESKTLYHLPGTDWITIVGKNGSPEFAAAFVERPILTASVLRNPCVGAESIGAFFGVASKMYDTITFTNETVDRGKTYLEWEGKVFGLDVRGATILTRDPAGLIESIQLYHSPLHVLTRFCAELESRLGNIDLLGRHGPSRFSTSGSLSQISMRPASVCSGNLSRQRRAGDLTS